MAKTSRFGGCTDRMRRLSGGSGRGVRCGFRSGLCVSGRVRSGRIGGEFERDIARKTQVDTDQVRIARLPFGNMRQIHLIPRGKVVCAKVDEQVGAFAGKRSAKIVRIREVNLGDLRRGMGLGVVEIRKESLIKRHALLRRSHCRMNVQAGYDGKRVMVKGHARRRDGKQHSIRIHKFDIVALSRKGNRSSLDDVNKNLIGKNAHDCGVLNPWDRFELTAALNQRHQEDIAANILTEDGEHLVAGDLSGMIGLRVNGSRKRSNLRAGIEAEVNVAQKVTAEEQPGGKDNREKSCGDQGKHDPACSRTGQVTTCRSKFADISTG